MSKIQKELAMLLKKSRKDSGLSQAQVADKLGYTTPQFVSNWERGMSSPPASSIKQLAELYKIPLSDLKQLLVERAVEEAREKIERSFRRL